MMVDIIGIDHFVMFAALFWSDVSVQIYFFLVTLEMKYYSINITKGFPNNFSKQHLKVQ